MVKEVWLWQGQGRSEGLFGALCLQLCMVLLRQCTPHSQQKHFNTFLPGFLDRMCHGSFGSH